MAGQSQSPRRAPRSYVVRHRRASSASQANFARLYARFGLDPKARPVWREVFDGKLAAGPINVDIGFGSGESVLHYALAEPARALVGFEVYPVGVASLLRQLERDSLDHVRVVHADASGLLERWFAPGALGCVRLFFPDPWPKRRHRKRRLADAPFVALLARLLGSGGLFHLKSDAEDYVRQVQRLCAARRELALEEVGKCGLGAGGPVTRFERRARAAGKDVWQLRVRRR